MRNWLNDFKSRTKGDKFYTILLNVVAYLYLVWGVTEVILSVKATGVVPFDGIVDTFAIPALIWSILTNRTSIRNGERNRQEDQEKIVKLTQEIELLKRSERTQTQLLNEIKNGIDKSMKNGRK